MATQYESWQAAVEIPSEFRDLCNLVDKPPNEVLQGFISDLCELKGSHGSDERERARAWFDRVYGRYGESEL